MLRLLRVRYQWSDEPEQTVLPTCQEDECCDGRSCYGAPFRTGCTPVPEMVAEFGIEDIVYPD